MKSFIHLSDLHIHKNNERKDNQNCIAIVNEIINIYQEKKPVILITGDIVDDGHEAQYRNAVKILKPLVENDFIVLAVPGNHDYGPLGNFYTEKSQMHFQKYILADLLGYKKVLQEGVTMELIYPIISEFDEMLFIGVDSVVGAENELLHFASGEVGKPQREKIQQILHEYKNSNKKKVVYFHHHPFDRRYVMEMDDAKELMRLLAGKVDFVCFGHDHKSEIFYSKNQIECMMASGKTPKKNKSNKFQFREVKIYPNGNKIAMVSFK